MAARNNTKSFSSKKTKAEPIKFTLEDQEFEVYGNVPGSVLLEFMEYAGSESAAETAKGIRYYLEHSMDKATYKRFKTLIDDPDILIDIETLSEIVSYLIEERTSRPTEAS